jgi:tyrosyl-tRNA synthetase
MIKIDQEKIEEVLTRGVENIYPDKETLRNVLLSGKKIKLYNGIDPTGKLHIGHSAVLNKLRQFQDLGHEIIVLFGGFTATIGDPTGKSKTRKPLTKKEVLTNAKDYKKLIGKILDLKKSNIKFVNNETWTNKLKPFELISITSNFTVARLLERDMFQERIKAGEDIHLHEFLYPVLQAYDSVAMNVDMEIGGNDQTFNMLAGRNLMKKMKNKEKFVLTTKLLTDATGKKMGKTEGNMVSLDENPSEMFGKIMSWPDELISIGFEICTRLDINLINQYKNQIQAGENPKNFKILLAKEIVRMYHSEKDAKKAEDEFNKIHRDKELPTEIEIFQTNKSDYQVLDLLCDTRLVESKNEAKRLIKSNAVSTNINNIETKITDYKQEIKLENGLVIKVGKRRFIKIKII